MVAGPEFGSAEVKVGSAEVVVDSARVVVDRAESVSDREEAADVGVVAKMCSRGTGLHGRRR